MSDPRRPTPAQRRQRHPGVSRLAGALADETGGTSLEWALLLAAIALPLYVALRLCLGIITAHFGMVSTVNGLPFP